MRVKNAVAMETAMTACGSAKMRNAFCMAAMDAAATMPVAAMPAAALGAMPAAAVPAADAPAAAVPAAAAPVPVTVYSIGPLRDSKGPIQLDAAGYAVVARLRGQLAASTAAEDTAPDDATRAAAAAKSRFLLQELAAVQAGFLDASAIATDDSAAMPVCVMVGRQCGGLQPGSNTDPWQGISACCGNSTCVQTDPNFAQCVPIAEVRKHPPPFSALLPVPKLLGRVHPLTCRHARVVSQSRPRGCSALNAQCGGDFWDGPGCCATDLGCMWQSRAFSKCSACNKLWEQWCARRARAARMAAVHAC